MHITSPLPCFKLILASEYWKLNSAAFSIEKDPRFPCLTRVLGPPYCGDFHATGICRIVLVMQTCDVSAPYVSMPTTARVLRGTSPLIYRAVSLFVRMCETI